MKCNASKYSTYLYHLCIDAFVMFLIVIDVSFFACLVEGM
jgi:hypothetical protein